MKTAKVIFSLRVDKVSQETGEAPIYCRITVDGKRSDMSINRSVHPQRWKDTNQLRKAKKQEDRELNFYMESIKSKIKEIERELLDQKIPITSENIKNLFSGNSQKSKSLIELIKWHNEKLQDLVLTDEAAEGTLDRYKTTLKHVKSFLKYQYNKTDMFLDELEFNFITNFDHYLRTERISDKGRKRKCGNNSAVKYVSNVRKIISMAVDEGWLKYDVFVKYKGKVKVIEKAYLTPEEIERIQNKEITIQRLSVIRDIFLFSIYTGYAYAEVVRLTYRHIQKHIDGERWAFIKRRKNKVNENVMLLHPAEQLIEKYRTHPVCIQKGVLFPVPTNQRINTYLKELADICGIEKNLTFHMGRHSFATSIMLANGMSMETTRDVIGHVHMKQTQHYAKMLNSKVSNDMKQLNEKFKPAPTENPPLKVIK